MTEGPPLSATPPGGAEEPTAEAAAVVARPGSHRAKRSPYSVIGPVVVVAVAVVAVGVGIYGWLTAADAPQSLPPVIPAVSTPTPTPSPTVSATPSTSPSPTPSASKTPKPTPTPTPKPSKTATPVSRTTPVVVLNQTSITGLAASTGAMLERKGWQVVGLGNWRGDIAQTTVYYPPGKQTQAEQLAKDLGADRIRPRVSGMRADRLTVILTSRPT